ncbi:MAG TPA: hypothetical protein VGF31_05445, partial [Myxococcaceae bacterium]
MGGAEPIRLLRPALLLHVAERKTERHARIGDPLRRRCGNADLLAAPRRPRCGCPRDEEIVTPRCWGMSTGGWKTARTGPIGPPS